MRLTPARYVRRNLWYSRGVNLAIAVIVACIATVLTGALLVGDSMRFSLRRLTLQRLGPVDSAIRRGNFFVPTQALTTLATTGLWKAAVPGIVLDGSLTIDESAAMPVACGATLVGIDDEFWNAWFRQEKNFSALRKDGQVSGTSPTRAESSASFAESPPSTWNENEVVVNRPLANALAVASHVESVKSAAGDLIVLEPDSIPAESTFGKKDDVHARFRVQIRDIIESDMGPGSFSLASDQSVPALAFVPLKRLQKYLDRTGQVNTIFLLNDPKQPPVSPDAIAQVRTDQPILPLKELGLDVSQQSFTGKRADGTGKTAVPLACVYIDATDFLFSERLKSKITRILSPLQTGDCLASPVCIYLANAIEKIQTGKPAADAGKQTAETPNESSSSPAMPPVPHPVLHPVLHPVRASVPYSLVAGIDPQLLTKFITSQAATRPTDPIWINQFLADQLRIVSGNRIRLTFFLPDTPNGLHRETSESFTVAGIIPDSSPLDAHLVPTVHGLTDATTLADWNPTFPFDARRITKQDEDFWEQHHTAPKAFIPLDRAEKLFGSRFGSISSFCILAPQAECSAFASSIRQKLESQISLDDASSPMTPFRAQAVAASTGTTPFDVLFLCFSSFLIASVLLMLIVLVRLSLDLKHRELGVLMTLGFSPSRISLLVLGELLVPLFWGSLVGTLLAGLYTRLMIYGLCHWWIGAIGTPFVQWNARPGSFVTGMTMTFASCALAAMFVLRRVGKMQPIEAVSRVTILPASASREKRCFPRLVKTLVGCVLLLTAGLLVCYGTNVAFLTPDAKAGLFFGSASMVLAGVILLFDARLARHARGTARSANMTLGRFVVSNLSRHQGRTMLTVSLLASSLFVVGATGIFRLDIPPTPPGKTPPLCVETRLPIFDNLSNEHGRNALMTDPDDAKTLAQSQFVPFRVRPGQRTGCSNLYRAGNHLRLLGVPTSYLKHLDEKTQEKYTLLNRDISPAIEDSDAVARVPILLDRNTAMYALQIYTPGAILQLRNDQGQLVYGQVVDFLDQSIFQSEVIMSEANLLKYFPEVTGWQFFYVAQTNQQDALASASLKTLEGAVARTLGDYGPSIETVPERLGRFFQVQNGYITIFQTLGALGVLLGTLGLAGLQVQDLYARRRELALLQTIGFSRKRLFALLFLENSFMLLLAVLMAWLAMVVAVWPQLQNQLAAGTLAWTVLVPSVFFTLSAAGILLVGLLSFAFVWRMSQKQTGFQYLLDA